MLCMCSGCASIVAPTGGEKDVAPPELVASTPQQGELNVHTKRIALTFNEYVKVKKRRRPAHCPATRPTAPNLSILRKTLFIEFPDSLPPNTTITLSLGSSIGDLTEGNEPTGISLAFSTGNILDTARVAGSVFDALTSKPVPKATVGLYRLPLSLDTLRRAKPLYVALTQADGGFEMRNVSPGTYYVVSFFDGNNNLTPDYDREPSGFAPSPLHVADTNATVAPITLSIQAQPLMVRTVKAFGVSAAKVIFNQPVDSVSAQLNGRPLTVEPVCKPR